MTTLPGILSSIAAAAGEEAALAIAKARGGTQIYVPPEPEADHWLSQLVGHEAAIAIGQRLTWGVAGVRVVVPLATGPRIDRLIDAGLSERAIALETGSTIRTVRRRRAQLRKMAADSNQMTLL